MAAPLDVRHVLLRRRRLMLRYPQWPEAGGLEESCVPSYCHGNIAAAYVAWWRLFAARALWRAFSGTGPVLDFGASVGELAALLPDSIRYDFIEGNDALAGLASGVRDNVARTELMRLAPRHYAAIFALDSLEHNGREQRQQIYAALLVSLRRDGVLILSGPTENALYRLGRWISGFSGDYHQTNVYDIQRELARHLKCVRHLAGPFGIPLFVVSAWTNRTP